MSHVCGQRVIRQLALEESLTADDLLPTWRRMPTAFSADGAAVMADINPGSITTAHIVPGAVSANSLYSDDAAHVVSLEPKRSSPR